MASSSNQGDHLTPTQRNLLLVWCVGLVSLLLLAAWLTIRPAWHNRIAAAQRHQARLDPAAADPGATLPDDAVPPGAKPTEVQAGIYVDRIVELSIKDMNWTVEFFLWFRWSGDSVRPGEGFQVVDGSIESVVCEEQYTAGDEHYERYRVIARITKPFDLARFPCDDHLLAINIENPAYQRHQMLLVADRDNSSVSSRVKVPAYAIHGVRIIEKPHSYKTTRGDPRLTAGVKSTYSQLRLGIGLARDSWGFYFKMFQALYVAVMIALLALFIKPTNVDPRFGLGVGGLFAAVANSYVIASLIPDTGVMTVADVVNGIGIGMILLTLIQSTLSLYLFERLGLETLSRRLDQSSFAILASGYLALSIALPLAASAV